MPWPRKTLLRGFILSVLFGSLVFLNTGSAQAQPLVDLELIKTADIATARVGDTVVYTLHVDIVGGSMPIGNATLQDSLPSEMQFISFAGPDGADCLATGSSGGTTVSCDFGQVDASDPDREITVTAKVLAGAGTTVTNTASIAATGDPNAANNQSAADIEIASLIDVSVTKTANVPAARVGDTVIYTLHVAIEGGASPIGDVTLADSIPAEMEFVGFGGSDVADCLVTGSSGGGGSLNCDFGQMDDAHPVREVTLSLKVIAGEGTTVTNTATIAASGDADTTNNQSSVDVTIPDTIDFSITKKANVATAQVGDTIVYTLKVAIEDGASPIGDVTLADSIPAEMEFVGFGGPDVGNCLVTGSSGGGSSLSCDFGQIDGWDPNREVTLTVKVVGGEGTVVTNTGTLEAVGDENPANNQSSVDVAILSQIDLSVTKTANVTSARVGDSVIYTLRIQAEDGEVATGDVILKDDIPVEMEFVSIFGGDALSYCLVTSASGAGSAIHCDFGPIDGNDPDREIDVLVKVVGGEGTTVMNTATIEADSELNTENNSSSAEVQILMGTSTPNPSATPIPSPSPTPPNPGTIGGSGCSLGASINSASTFYLWWMVGLGMVVYRRLSNGKTP